MVQFPLCFQCSVKTASSSAHGVTKSLPRDDRSVEILRFAQDDNRPDRGIPIRAAGRGETKNPPCQSARRVSENLLGNSKSSLAVFYVEQVALNRHVSPQPQLTLLCLSACPMSRGHEIGHRRGQGISAPLRVTSPAPSTCYDLGTVTRISPVLRSSPAARIRSGSAAP